MSGSRILTCEQARELAALLVGHGHHVVIAPADALAARMREAAEKDQAFDVIVTTQGEAHGVSLAAVMSAPAAEIVVLGAGAHDRMLGLPADLAPEMAAPVVTRLAGVARERATAQAARMEFDSTNRAYKVVSAEFQRQNRQLKTHEEKLLEQNLLFDAALNNMSQGLCMFNRAGRLMVRNERYLEMYGLSGDVAKPGCSLQELLAHRAERGNFVGDIPQYCDRVTALMTEGKASSAVTELADGRTIMVTNQPMANGGWVATHEDITERTKAEARIRHLARHDPLTNLPNRSAFADEMERALSRVRRGDILAVLCLDLDNFKNVNDSLGHQIGDRLLCLVADRLRTCVRDLDFVVRLGGDEFTILQTGIQGAEDAAALAERLIKAISAPYRIDTHDLNIGTSIGIAMAPDDGMDAERLLRNADMALYRAKSDGRATYSFFEARMDAEIQARRALELDLRGALAKGEFALVYQPLMNAASGEITGCEALLRWHCPSRGTVSPVDFIPIAEDTGLIVPLGEWVLRQACTEAAGWPSHIKIAVNLSPAQFKSRNLVQTVVNALAQSGLPASRLELEITESVLLQESDATMATLHQLRELGIRISMDDFGTGYSSFSYLRSFPFDKIKIDRSFVSDLSKEGDCAAIIKAVAGLGRGMGITTTAEGVETAEQLEHVRAEGCTEVQGYLFSRPLPPAEIRAFIGKRRADSAAA
jgi:diguanylate cyclase (GGDEF)-like protein